jgi:hypothetical protein
MIWEPQPSASERDLLADMDPQEWWVDSASALREYVGLTPTDVLVASVEDELGRRLPPSYLAMMRRHNGGIPRLSCFPTVTPTTWAEDHVAVTGVFGIGRDLTYSLCGPSGSRFWIDEWGYPDLGVYFADCPSAGHDMLAMDYRDCGPEGEPRIVHVDQEWDYAVTVLAISFADFVRGLRAEEVFGNG